MKYHVCNQRRQDGPDQNPEAISTKIVPATMFERESSDEQAHRKSYATGESDAKYLWPSDSGRQLSKAKKNPEADE